MYHSDRVGHSADNTRAGNDITANGMTDGTIISYIYIHRNAKDGYNYKLPIYSCVSRPAYTLIRTLMFTHEQCGQQNKVKTGQLLCSNQQAEHRRQLTVSFSSYEKVNYQSFSRW